MRRSLRTAALTGMLAALAMCHGSCMLFAWMAAQFAPPKKVAAQFEPPKGKALLVFVDDILNPVSYEPVKIELTRRLNENLVAHDVAGKTISYDRLADLVASTPDFNLLAVSEVGQKLGADLVLYVRIDSFGLKDKAADQLWRGELAVTVRLVDVTQGRLWPKNRPAGYSMPAVETPTAVQSSETQEQEITDALAAQMADQIAKLFYKHETPHEGGWREPK